MRNIRDILISSATLVHSQDIVELPSKDVYFNQEALLGQEQGSPDLTSFKIWPKVDKVRLVPIPTSKARKSVIEFRKLKHKALLKQTQASSNIIQERKWCKEMLTHSLQQRQGLLYQTCLKILNQAKGEMSKQGDQFKEKSKKSKFQ